MIERVVKPRRFSRPCMDCRGFRKLSSRFGVCSYGEQPSGQSICAKFKKMRH